MWRCSESIGLARAAIVSNIWLLADREGRRFLVDTGYRLERAALQLALWRSHIRRPGDLTAVLLTHRHCDHAGNARWVRERLECPVCCHSNDAPILEGRKAPPPLSRGTGRLYEELCCYVEDREPAHCPVDEAFDTGPWRHGFHIYPAFGHTEGSVLIYHEPTRTLFTGDVLLTGIPPLRFLEHFSLAVPAFSIDAAACHSRVRSFLSDPPPVKQICPGHGPFVHRHAAAGLEQLARSCR